MTQAAEWKERAQRIRETVDLVELISREVELRKEGAVLKGCCPFHAETTPSFAVYPATQSYHCFGCQADGDAISWVRQRMGLSFSAALDHLEGGAPPRLSEPRATVRGEKARRYTPIFPVPDNAPPLPTEAFVPELKARLPAVAVWWYRSAGGSRLIADARFEGPHPKDPTRTKKVVITWCWAQDAEDGSAHWAMTRPSDDLPLYGLDRLFERPDAPVVICEGAKKADAILRHAPEFVGMSWCGGVGAVAKVDWKPLAGRRVILWADHDKVGADAVAKITTLLPADCTVELINLVGRLPTLPESWDAADAKTSAEILGLLERREPITPQALAAMLAGYPGDPPGGKAKRASSDPAAPSTSSARAASGPSPRTAWLCSAYPALRELLVAAKAPAFPDPNIHAGLPDGTKRSVVGLCCSHPADPTRPSDIYVGHDTLDQDPTEALSVLLHEMIHAAFPKDGHGKLFRAVAAAVGFDAPFSSHHPPETLCAKLDPIAEQLGKIPPAPPGEDGTSYGGDDGVERSDILNATRFIELHGKDVRWCPDLETWHVWDGMRWMVDVGEVLVYRLAEDTARTIAQGHLDQAEQLFQKASAPDCRNSESLRKRAGREIARAEQVQSRKKLQDMLTLARNRIEVAAAADDFDRDPHLLNCLNGIVDLRSGQIWKHDRKHLCSRLARANYDPEADRTRLMKIVRHVSNNDDQVAEYAQAILGMSIFGHNRLEQFYLWWGPPRSGKGTLMEAIKSALGDYCMSAEFQSFVKTQGYRVRDDLDRLKLGRLVLASEVEKGEEFASAVIKHLTGGDTIASRQLYGTYREFRPRMTLHLQANNRPKLDDTDDGMWERIRVIPCGPTVPEEKRDPGLKEHLLDPATGGAAVLSWLIEGSRRIHDARMVPMPPAVAAASATYRRDQDPTKEFFADGLRFASADNAERTFVRVTDLIAAYHKWADGLFIPKNHRTSEQSLGKRLDARGCWRKKKRIGSPAKPESVWFGVTLPDGSDHAALQSPDGGTFTPSQDEHDAALKSVPVFLRSASPANLAGARACAPVRARAPESLFNSSISRNTGTQEQEEKHPSLPAPTPDELSDPDLTAGFEGAP